LPVTATQPGWSIVVTGAGRPGQLGGVIAAACAADGARVSIVARTRSAAVDHATELARAGITVHSYACDLANPVATEALARTIVADAGRVDALVNAAGGFASGGAITAADPALLEDQFSVNVATAYFATRAFLPALRQARGSIVLFASAVALPGGRARDVAAYAIAKAGVVALTRAIAQEERAAGSGVRANAIAPGAIRTAANVAAMPADARFIDPGAVASLVLYLCSAAATHLTGQVIEMTP
jgi:3-oxoacyl-[acyl-carrier protein] reductase